MEILKAFHETGGRRKYIASHKGELLNSKSKWHQPKVVRTRTQVVQGDAEVVHHHHGGGGGRVGVQGVGGVGVEGEGRGRTLGGRVTGRSQGQ